MKIRYGSLLLTLAWRNLWRHPRRTGLTLAAIAFSAGLIVFVFSMNLGIIDTLIEYNLRITTGHAQVQVSGYLDQPQMHKTIDDATSLADRIRDESGLRGVAARAMGFALVSSQNRSYGAQVVGVEPNYEGSVSTIPGLVKQGRYLSDDYTQEAVIGATMARNLNLRLGDELTLLGTGKDGSFAATAVPVAGIFESGNISLDRYLVFLPLAVFQNVFSMNDSAHIIVLRGENPETTRKLVHQVSKLLPTNQKLVIVDWDNLQPGLRQLIKARLTTIWFLFSLLLVIVTFSVFNTFLMSVLERTREFGVMLAVGLTPRKIGGLIVLESVLMALAGIAIGVVIGTILTEYFVIYGLRIPGAADALARFNMPSVLRPKLVIASLTIGPGVVFIATLLAAAYPALRIRSLRPVDAMRAV